MLPLSDKMRKTQDPDQNFQRIYLSLRYLRDLYFPALHEPLPQQ